MITRSLFSIGNQIRLAGFQCARTISSTVPKLNQSLTTPNLDVLKNVDNVVSKASEGRLFAIVHLCGKQFKVTDGDIILVEGYWPPTIGDKIRLDKVLVAGGKDFSMIGAPILQPGLVDIQATVIEKTLSHTKTNFKKKKTKQYMRINFVRNQQTMIRINSIEIQKPVAEAAKEVVNDTKRIF